LLYEIISCYFKIYIYIIEIVWILSQKKKKKEIVGLFVLISKSCGMINYRGAYRPI